MGADRTGRPTQQVASSGQSQTVRPVLRIRRPCPPRARCTGQSGIVAATDGEPGWPPVCHQTGAAARRDDLIRMRSVVQVDLATRGSNFWLRVMANRHGHVQGAPLGHTSLPWSGRNRCSASARPELAARPCDHPCWAFRRTKEKLSLGTSAGRLIWGDEHYQVRELVNLLVFARDCPAGPLAKGNYERFY